MMKFDLPDMGPKYIQTVLRDFGIVVAGIVAGFIYILAHTHFTNISINLGFISTKLGNLSINPGVILINVLIVSALGLLINLGL